MNLLTLTLAADIERTPAVDAWVAEVAQLLNLEAQRQLSANAIDGAAVLHVRPAGKRFVIIDLTPHTVRFIETETLTQAQRRLARRGELTVVDTVRNKEISARTDKLWTETARSRLLSVRAGA